MNQGKMSSELSYYKHCLLGLMRFQKQMLHKLFTIKMSYLRQVKKPIILYVVMMSIHLHGLAQFSFPSFPTAVHVGNYYDTLLNTSAILKQAGIRQVYAYHSSPEMTKTFANKTVSVNKDGHITNVVICFAKSETGITLCINDTIWYDTLGRITDVVTTDNRNNTYLPYHIIYDLKEEKSNSVMEQSFADSSHTYQYFNSKGQQVKLRRREKGKEVENTLFYYNPDGLLNSTVSSYWRTFFFKRTKAGKNKMIEMENSFASYKWVYNGAGQCINCVIVVHKPAYRMPNRIYSESKTEIKYYYNPNGTLSKVKTSSSQFPEFTMYYSYL